MSDVLGGTGNFVPWDGGCLFIAHNVGVVSTHAHYAIQIVFGSERGVQLRPSERDEWTEYTGAMIPSRQPHAMNATRVRHNAVIFVEPETREGRALAELYLHGGITPIPDGLLDGVADALFETWFAHGGAPPVADAARRVVRALPRGVEPSVVSDERILRATAYVNAHLDAPLTLDAVAAEACLSPSRFRHLFVEETGMALRPYILWRRFIRAWELLTAGESISAAAHAAGFADAAHLSRTSRSMFGIPPSALRLLGPTADGAAPTS